jgi:alcohol dehydrogenase
VAGTAAGDVVAVLGPGIRGLSALVAAREAGAGFVLVTGRGDRDRPRLEAALRFGADAVVDVAADDPVRVLRRDAGALADVVVDVTAKAPAALGQAVALARPGGTVVLAGTRGTDETPGFSPDAVVGKELHLVGALGVDAPAYTEALALLASGRHPFAEVSRRIVGLDARVVAELLTDMSGEGAAPPLHGVVVPGSW